MELHTLGSVQLTSDVFLAAANLWQIRVYAWSVATFRHPSLQAVKPQQFHHCRDRSWCFAQEPQGAGLIWEPLEELDWWLVRSNGEPAGVAFGKR